MVSPLLSGNVVAPPPWFGGGGHHIGGLFTAGSLSWHETCMVTPVLRGERVTFSKIPPARERW